MRFRKELIPESAKCYTGIKFKEKPSCITIHWIGPYPGQSPDDVRKWWIDSNGEASAHFIVKEDEVLQCVETDTVAWHAGCLSGNYTSIGIEVCPCNADGEFSSETIATLKDLLDFKLPPLPLVRHYDWTGKACPKYYCNRPAWSELLRKLERADGTVPVKMKT